MKTRFLFFTFSFLFALSSLKAQWTDFGAGADDNIYDFIEYDGDLIAGGRFYHFDGKAANGLAIWRKGFNDEWQWEEMADAGWIFDMEMYNGDLYVAGDIGYVNSDPVGCIAKYNKNDPNGWSKVGNGGIGGYNLTADIWSLAVYNGELYAGGTFTSIGGTTARNIAVWDGTMWSQVGGGLQSSLYAGARKLFVYNNELYASGTFTQAGSLPVPGVAKWDGSAWSAVADFGMNGALAGRVNTFAEYNGSLYAAGNFSVVNNIPADGIAVFDGSSWSSGSAGLAPGTNISSLGIFKGELFASGTFGSVGKVIKWNSSTSSWIGFGTMTGGDASVLYEYSGSLIAGGFFTSLDGVTCNGIAAYPKLSPVGMSSEKMEGDKLYPNPFSGETVFYSAGNLENSKVILYNITGEVLNEYTNIAGKELTISRNDLSAGIYLLKIFDSGGKTQIHRLVITD